MALDKSMTFMDMKKKVYELIKGVYEKEIEGEEALNEQLIIQLRHNLPLMNLKSKHYREKPPCEICGKKHGMYDDFCNLVLDDVDVNASVENASKVTFQ